LVPATTLLGVIQDVDTLLSEFPEFILIRSAIGVEILANPVWAISTLDAGERVALLRALTGFTVAMEPDINCYPRGLAETFCFDADGNPIP